MVLNAIAAVVIVGVFGYWQIRERGVRSSTARSGHNPAVRRAIRVLMPLLALLLVAQLIDLLDTTWPLPSGLRTTLFIFGHALLTAGTVLAIWARETLGASWAHAADYQIVPGQSLVVRGPYRYIRHPIYSGLLGMFIGVEAILASPLLLLAPSLGWFMWWQARQEEILLTNTFGDVYRDYQQQTGIFLPKVLK